MISLLIERGADVNARNLWGMSALARVSQRGDTESAKLLIAKGADLDGAIAYSEGYLAQYTNSDKGKTGLVLLQEIKKQASPSKTEKQGSTEIVQSKPAVLSDIDEVPSLKTKANRNRP